MVAEHTCGLGGAVEALRAWFRSGGPSPCGELSPCLVLSTTPHRTTLPTQSLFALTIPPSSLRRRQPNMAPPLTQNTRTAAPSTTGTSTATTQTQTLTPVNPTVAPPPVTLRLRGAPSPAPASDRRIHWAEDVVDNEGLGRKSSKVCCIYHKTRAVGESSSEDDSDSSSEESESDDGDDGRARMSGQGAARRGHRPHGHGHEHESGDGDSNAGDCRKGNDGRKRSPNAYERMPRREGDKGSKA